jgi:hypothetical protein
MLTLRKTKPGFGLDLTDAAGLEGFELARQRAASKVMLRP